MVISLSIPLRMRNTSDNIVEVIKTHIFYSIFYFRNSAVYERLWKNIVEPGRPQMIIWRMRIACLLNKATHSFTTFSTSFPLQKWLHDAPECYIVLHCLSCFTAQIAQDLLVPLALYNILLSYRNSN